MIRRKWEAISRKVADLNLSSLMSVMRDGYADPELKKLRKLSETIKYSDPMSNEAIEGVEQRIQKVSELKYIWMTTDRRYAGM